MIRDEISEAAARIAGRVVRTPVMQARVAGKDVILKLELLQHTGSFKPRGAFNRLLRAQVPEAGVIAASGGNHGLAVAYAAAELGLRCEIFVPEVTPAVKVDRLSKLGADVTVRGAFYADALEASALRAAATGALEVHAYDHPDVVAGQGTIGLELSQQVPDADAVLVAVGGAGLIGGISGWYGEDVRLFGVEPMLAPTLSRALQEGRPVDVDVGGVAADSLGARTVGSAAFELARAYVDGVMLVDDHQIMRARQLLWDEFHLVAEPGGAAALAAVLEGMYQPEPGEVTVVVVCGSNTDPADLS